MKRKIMKMIKIIKHSFLYLEEFRLVTNYLKYSGLYLNYYATHDIVLTMAAYRDKGLINDRNYIFILKKNIKKKVK